MKEEQRCLLSEFNDYFNYVLLTGNQDSLSRWVIVPDINRPGLELAGFYEKTEPRRIVIIGAKEIAYINTLDDEIQKERFEALTDGYTPAIVITHNQECPPLLRAIAERKNFPIFATDLPTYRVMVDIVTFLDTKLAPSDSVHGVLMSIYGNGVLITGESGMGKSEIALELINRNHVLISDDRVDVYRVHNTLIGKAPDILKGMLEIRGIGVIDVNRMFGANATLDQAELDFIVHLEKWDDSKEYRRVGIEHDETRTILDVPVPEFLMPLAEGRNMAILIESLVGDFALKSKGINTAREFEQRVYDYIEAQNKGVKR